MLETLGSAAMAIEALSLHKDNTDVLKACCELLLYVRFYSSESRQLLIDAGVLNDVGEIVLKDSLDENLFIWNPHQR